MPPVTTGSEEGLRNPAGRLDLRPFAFLRLQRVRRTMADQDGVLQSFEVTGLTDLCGVDGAEQDVSDPEQRFVTTAPVIDPNPLIEALSLECNDVCAVLKVLCIGAMFQGQFERLQLDHVVVERFQAFPSTALVPPHSFAQVRDDDCHGGKFSQSFHDRAPT